MRSKTWLYGSVVVRVVLESLETVHDEIIVRFIVLVGATDLFSASPAALIIKKLEAVLISLCICFVSV